MLFASIKEGGRDVGNAKTMGLEGRAFANTPTKRDGA